MELNLNYKPPSDEEIESTQDFDALLDRYYAETKNKKYATWQIAASIVFMLSFCGVFAYFLIPMIGINEVKSKKNSVSKPTEISVFDSLKLEPQWFKLDNSQTQTFETKAGLGFTFDKKSFKNANAVLVNISEVTDSVLLHKYFLNYNTAFFIAFFDANTKQALETIKPILIATKWQNELIHNADFRLKDNWIKTKNQQPEIQKLNKNTTDYLEYIQAKSVLDSIQINKQMPKNENKIVFNFSKKYVLKLTEFITKYEKNSNFNTNVKLALQSLKKYNQQHTIAIQKTDIQSQFITINQKGWWAMK